jgi:hypothetical protein
MTVGWPGGWCGQRAGLFGALIGPFASRRSICHSPLLPPATGTILAR